MVSKKSPKTSSKTSSKTSKAPKTYYHSESTSWSSSPKNSNQFGKRNIVTIENGKGTKIAETLNRSGKTLKTVKKTLKRKEVDEVLKGKFISGFWNNCAIPGACL